MQMAACEPSSESPELETLQDDNENLQTVPVVVVSDDASCNQTQVSLSSEEQRMIDMRSLLLTAVHDRYLLQWTALMDLTTFLRPVAVAFFAEEITPAVKQNIKGLLQLKAYSQLSFFSAAARAQHTVGRLMDAAKDAGCLELTGGILESISHPDFPQTY